MMTLHEDAKQAGSVIQCAVLRSLDAVKSEVRACDSNAGFSIMQLMNTDRYCLTMKGFTLAPLFFLFMVSTSDLARNRTQLRFPTIEETREHVVYNHEVITAHRL